MRPEPHPDRDLWPRVEFWVLWVPVVLVLAVACVAIGAQAAEERLPGAAFGLWCVSIGAGVLALHLGVFATVSHWCRWWSARTVPGADPDPVRWRSVITGTGWTVVYGLEMSEPVHPAAAWVDRWMRWVTPGLVVGLVLVAWVVELS